MSKLTQLRAFPHRIQYDSKVTRSRHCEGLSIPSRLLVLSRTNSKRFLGDIFHVFTIEPLFITSHCYHYFHLLNVSSFPIWISGRTIRLFFIPHFFCMLLINCSLLQPCIFYTSNMFTKFKLSHLKL